MYRYVIGDVICEVFVEETDDDNNVISSFSFKNNLDPFGLETSLKEIDAHVQRTIASRKGAELKVADISDREIDVVAELTDGREPIVVDNVKLDQAISAENVKLDEAISKEP
jgi:hypothetical protein